MSIEKLEQNTENWVTWRHKGIGSSDVPIILGVSKYMTRSELLEIKKLPEPPKRETTHVQMLGHKFEPVALSMLSFELGALDFEPELFVSHTHNFLRASCDGYSKALESIAEIKYVGRARLDEVKKNKRALEDHYPQVQHQLYCSNAKVCYYACYTLDKGQKEVVDFTFCEVYRNDAFINITMLPECLKFWDEVSSS